MADKREVGIVVALTLLGGLFLALAWWDHRGLEVELEEAKRTLEERDVALARKAEELAGKDVLEERLARLATELDGTSWVKCEETSELVADCLMRPVSFANYSGYGSQAAMRRAVIEAIDGCDGHYIAATAEDAAALAQRQIADDLRTLLGGEPGSVGKAPRCHVRERCTGGVDENGDGRVDCADPECEDACPKVGAR